LLETFDATLRGDVRIRSFQQTGCPAGVQVSAKAARTTIVAAMFDGLRSVSPQPPSVF